MTEAGKKWVMARMNVYWDLRGPAVGEAEFWLRAFCEEVERRATQFNRGYDGRADWCVSEAFKSIKRELL